MLKTENGQFAKDIEFGIVPSKIHEWWAVYKASESVVAKGEIPDIELDVSDISPTILLACINNSYATGLSCCVGLDMTFEVFSENMVNTMDFTEDRYLGLFTIFKKLLIKYDKTGKINTKEWNTLAKYHGHIWTHHGDITNNTGSIIAHDTIEEIVKSARKLQNKYTKK